MAKKILIVTAAIIAIVLVVASMQSSEYAISRTVSINAKPEAIFPHLCNPVKSNAWSPWLKKDPKAKITYAGTEEGASAKTSWDGNSEIGAGTSTIMESRTNEFVRIKLDFLRPLQSTAETVFTLKSEEGHTLLTWKMFGKKAFVQKIFCMFMNMDKTVGKTFEEGLDNLKTIVEKQ